MALERTTGGTTQEIAALFPNVRGLGGALGLTANNGEKFQQTLDAINQTSADLNRQKALQVMSTDANRVTAEFNKLKNALTNDVGNRLLDLGAGFVDLGINAQNVTAILGAFGPVLATGTAVLGAYAIAAYKGATANAAFMKSFKGASAGLLLAAGAAAGGSFLGDELIEAVRRPQAEFSKVAKEAIADLQRSENERLKVQSDANEKRLQDALRTVQELNKAYLSDVDNVEAAGRLLQQSSERITGDILRGREDFVKSLQQSTEDANRAIEGSRDRIGGIETKRDDRSFEQSTRSLEDAQKVFALTSRANDLARQAASALAAGDKGGLGWEVK